MARTSRVGRPPAPSRARPRRGRRAALALGVAVAGLGAFVSWEWATLPEAAPLAKADPPTTALIEQRAEEARAEGRKPRRRQRPVPLAAVAPRAVDAVILSEDAGFYQHDGIDTGELEAALREAWEEKELGRGASTITQQLAKNLWLSTDRSLLRKAKEYVLARRLEEALPKKRILSLYLNVVEWGDGVYGIEAAAQAHFGVAAKDLTVAQGAVLASMLPAPRRWSPAPRSPAPARRSRRLVDRLLETGRIDADAAEEAHEELDELFGPARAAED